MYHFSVTRIEHFYEYAQLKYNLLLLLLLLLLTTDSVDQLVN